MLTSNYAADGLLSDPEFHERFLPTIWLVDIFYDRKRALFIASDKPIEEKAAATRSA